MNAYKAMTDTARLALDWRKRALVTFEEVLDDVLDSRVRGRGDRARRTPDASSEGSDHDFETWDRLPV
jgi:hypothetical protein